MNENEVKDLLLIYDTVMHCSRTNSIGKKIKEYAALLNQIKFLIVISFFISIENEEFLHLAIAVYLNLSKIETTSNLYLI